MLLAVKSVVLAAAAMFVFTGFAQDVQAQDDIKPLLQRLNYWRYGNIFVYKVKQPVLGELKTLLVEDSDGGAAAGSFDNLPAEIQAAINVGVGRSGGSKTAVINYLITQGINVDGTIDAAIDEKLNDSGPKKKVSNVYLVTTRTARNQINKTVIIGLLYSYKDKEGVKDNLDFLPESQILTYDELALVDMDETKFGAGNLYDYCKNALIQGNCANVTPEAQGLAQISLGSPSFGNSVSLISDEADITDMEIQKFLRISEGEPSSYTGNNLVVVGPDLVSYRRYEDPWAAYYVEEEVVTGDDEEVSEEEVFEPIVNDFLPKYGVELRYGIDEIHYTGLWSSRAALNAVWSNARLGVILPTDGWSLLHEELFDQERGLTHGGVGINGSFDFPIKIVPKSGVFHTSFGYVFGDAQPASWKEDARILEPLFFEEDPNDVDHMVRAHGQVHYTFAVSVDEDYQFRFGFGGTAYQIESWGYGWVEDPETLVESIQFIERTNETIAGVSGRVELLVLGATTPYGLGVQYFDEAISGNLWLQLPFTEQVALRMDVKGFAAVMRDAYEWETQSSVIAPSFRVIYNF